VLGVEKSKLGSKSEVSAAFYLNNHSSMIYSLNVGVKFYILELEKEIWQGISKIYRCSLMSWEDVKLIPSSGKTINSSKVGMCLEL
jgi:hypothetical protein